MSSESPQDHCPSRPEPPAISLARRQADIAPSPFWCSNTRDGSLLRLVPAGSFIMGSTAAEIEAARAMDHDGELFHLGHEMPQFRPFVRAFYIGVYAITNEQFAHFLTMRRPSLAEIKLWLPMTDHIHAPRSRKGRYAVDAGFERHPAVHLSWFGATAYCEWAGLRLPTEIEWEKAARGTDGRIFPWGNDWDESRLRWHGGDRQEGETTAPVDAYVEGCSPFGCFQMAGNVEEWCSDPYRSDSYLRFAKGHLAPPPTGYGRVVRGGHVFVTTDSNSAAQCGEITQWRLSTSSTLDCAVLASRRKRLPAKELTVQGLSLRGSHETHRRTSFAVVTKDH